MGRVLALLALLAGLMAVPAVPGGAAAALLCGDRAAIVGRLAGEYGESPVASGIAADGRLVEIFAAPDGGWTILYTIPGGPSCLLAAGENWQDLTGGGKGPAW